MKRRVNCRELNSWVEPRDCRIALGLLKGVADIEQSLSHETVKETKEMRNVVLVNLQIDRPFLALSDVASPSKYRLATMFRADSRPGHLSILVSDDITSTVFMIMTD